MLCRQYNVQYELCSGSIGPKDSSKEIDAYYIYLVTKIGVGLMVKENR